MRRPVTLAGAIALAAMLARASVAEEAEGTSDVTETVGADGLPSITISVTPGFFEEWKEDRIAGIYALKTRVTSVRLGPYGQWLPSFAAALHNGGERAQLSVFSAQPWLPLGANIKRTRNDEVQLLDELLPVALTPAVPVTLMLNWTRDGTVCVTVTQGSETESRLMSVDGAPTHVVLFASGGEFRFDSVELVPRPAGDAVEQDFAIKANCVPVS